VPNFDSCSSLVYGRCYPARLVIDAQKEKRLGTTGSSKNQYICVCWVFPAPPVVSAIEEGSFKVEGHDGEVDGSREKGDMGVFGVGCSRERPVNCDSAAGWIMERWVRKWIERREM
jgi:hypothetical protein